MIGLCFSPMGDSAVAQEQRAEKDRKFHISLGVSPFIFGDSPFVGGNFAFGYVIPSKKHLLILDIGGGSGDSKHIGDYSYIVTTTNAAGQTVNSETRTDGKVSYQYAIMEYTLSWNWLFDISEKWKFRAGPGFGLLLVTGRDTYSPTSYKGATIEGIPESQSLAKQAAMGGVIAGLTYNFSKRWFFDVDYRLTVNSGIHFAERNMTILGKRLTIESKEFGAMCNRFSLSLGWRF